MKRVKRVQTVGSISQFVNREEETVMAKLKSHYENHHVKYKIAGSFIIISIAGGVDFATPTLAADVYDIDARVRPFYDKLMQAAKWIIVFKGGLTIIKAVANEDFEKAKKSGFGYVMIYLILLGLPFLFDQADLIFKDVTVE